MNSKVAFAIFGIAVVLIAIVSGSAGAPGAAKAATSSDWYWEGPWPQGNGLRAVWGSSSSDVFAVGCYGTILHYDGSLWRVVTSGTTGDLWGVWGSSFCDVFAVGGAGTILHYDGNAWSLISTGVGESLMGVWGSSSSDVFAVGGAGTILHYDGSAWSTMNSGTTEDICGVWGSSPSDVFAVGGGSTAEGGSGVGAEGHGTILHYDGTSWNSTPGPILDLHAVWGRSSCKVFAIGTTDSVLHYDGNTWDNITADPTVYVGVSCPWSLHGVWGSSDSDVFVVGSQTMFNYPSMGGEVVSLEGASIILHYDGRRWSTMASGTRANLNGIWGSSSSDVFAVGEGGTILHYDGSGWSVMGGNGETLNSVWGSSASDVFAVGDHGVVVHYDGSAWSTMSSGTDFGLRGVWGSCSSDVFAVGEEGTILHYDGHTWHNMSTLTAANFNGVWGSSSSDVFALGQSAIVGQSGIYHYDGTAWTSAYTEKAPILIADGAYWTSPHTDNAPILVSSVASGGILGSTSSLSGIWGSSPSDVFAAEGGSTIIHYDGRLWRVMASCSTGELRGFWGSSSSDVFAVGSAGTILHYDGSAWSTMNSGTTEDIRRVWGSSSSNLIAVGDGGTILHYDGNSWSQMARLTGNQLNGVWGSSSSDVFAMGNSGTILHYGPNQLTIALTYHPVGWVGVAYSQTVGAFGGNGSYTWSLSSGTLPRGLSLDLNNGVVSGTPTTCGTSRFTLKVSDGTVTATKKLSISVIPSRADASRLSVTAFDNEMPISVDAEATSGVAVSFSDTGTVSGTVQIVRYLLEPTTPTVRFSAATHKVAALFIDVEVNGFTAGSATITVHYADGQVAGLRKPTLQLYYWDGDRWEQATDTVVDYGDNTVSGSIPVSALSGTPVAMGGSRVVSAWGLIGEAVVGAAVVVAALACLLIVHTIAHGAQQATLGVK
jgi:hypothetical protein